MKRILYALVLCAIPAAAHAQVYSATAPVIRLGSTDTRLKIVRFISARTSAGADTASMTVDVIQGAGFLESVTGGGAWPSAAFLGLNASSPGSSVQWSFASPRLESFSIDYDATAGEAEIQVALKASGSIKAGPNLWANGPSGRTYLSTASISVGADAGAEVPVLTVTAGRSGSALAGTLVLDVVPQLAAAYQQWYEAGTMKPIVISFLTKGIVGGGAGSKSPYVALTANARPISRTVTVGSPPSAGLPDLQVTFALTDVRFTTSPPAAVTLAPLSLTATGVKPPETGKLPSETGKLPPAEAGTVRVAFPTGGVLTGTATFICQLTDGKTQLMIAFGGEGGLLGAINGFVPRAAAGTYNLVEDEERGLTMAMARLSPPIASFPANAGTITITEWTKAVVRGSFRFTGQTEDGNGATNQHVVTGSFNATRSIGC